MNYLYHNPIDAQKSAWWEKTKASLIAEYYKKYGKAIDTLGDVYHEQWGHGGSPWEGYKKGNSE